MDFVTAEENDDDIYVRSSDMARKRRTDYLKKKRRIALTDITYIAGYTDDGGNYVHQRKHSKLEQYYKKISNKKIRRYKGDFSGHGDYRKVFDLWWTLW